MNIFGNAQPKLTPAEQAKEWKRNITKEMRSIDRDIEKLHREEKKSLLECKKLLKDKQNNAARMLAKEVVNVRNTIARMHTAKAQLNSVNMNLQTSVCKCNLCQISVYMTDKYLPVISSNVCVLIYAQRCSRCKDVFPKAPRLWPR